MERERVRERERETERETERERERVIILDGENDQDDHIFHILCLLQSPWPNID